MDGARFVAVIKQVVRESAIEDTIDNLERPPGREPSDVEKSRSEWFNGLAESERATVEGIVEDAVDEALFGLLAVIDGVRAIEGEGEKGQLVLLHRGQEDRVLNDPETIDLHGIYCAES